jgi:hypothetical protein
LILFLIIVGAVILYAIVSAVVRFIKNNSDAILLVLSVLGIIALILICSIFAFKLISYSTKRKKYQNSYYYKETLIPYHRSLEERGVRFEIETYDRIRQEFGTKVLLLTDVLVPQSDSINKDSQIDLIIFHTSGIYVVEMKNYSGPLIGNKFDEYWVPYYQEKKKNKAKKSGYFQSSFKVMNPINQNEIHIRTLKSLANFDYFNSVILSDSMFVDMGKSKNTIEGVYSVNDFVEFVKGSPEKYLISELDSIYQSIKSYDMHGNEKAKQLHIARIKSKERKF